MLGLGACFSGTFLNGQPCASDAECGPSLACEQGFCGGPPPGSSTSTTAPPSTTTTGLPTSSIGVTEGATTTTSGATTGDPTTSTTAVDDTSTGPTCGYGRCKDIDLVLIVDNSPSMKDKEPALLSALVSFSTYIQPELQQACSVHLGITTTDVKYQFNKEECQKPGALVQRGNMGDDCVTAEGNPYATLEDLDAPAPLLCFIQVGSGGSTDERPIEVMFQLFSTGLNAPGGCNEGFIRNDAQMVIVIVTDEDDDDMDAQGHNGSVQPPTIWKSGLTMLKPQSDLLMLGLLGDDDQMNTMCPWDPFFPAEDGSGAEASPRLRQFFSEFPPEQSAVGTLCPSEEPGAYDPLMEEVQMKLRTMCGV